MKHTATTTEESHILSHRMTAIQTETLQAAFDEALKAFEDIDLEQHGKADTCLSELHYYEVPTDITNTIDASLTRYISILTRHIYRQGLKDAMEKPELAKAILKYASDDDRHGTILDIDSPLSIYDYYLPIAPLHYMARNLKELPVSNSDITSQ